MLRYFICFAFLATLITTTPAQSPKSDRSERRRDRGPDKLQEGDMAPDFMLKSPDGKQAATLSDYRGKKPVALVFGSYTWPPFRRQVGALDKMYDDYGEQVEFFMVYIREAHPIDGRVSKRNEREKIFIQQPKSMEERTAVAKTMCSVLEIKLPALVDTIDDKTSRDYSALPDRLYLVGIDGRIVYKGARGPRGFDADELRQEIKLLLETDPVGTPES